MNCDHTPLAFDFEENPIRVVLVDEQPWWVAVDICRALDIRNTSQAVAALDDDERSMYSIGRQGQTNIINEPGLYRLIFTSRKDAAERFKRWLAHDVLPALRRTGSYAMPSTNTMEDEHLTRWSVSLATIREARRLFGNTVAKRMWTRLDLPDPQVPAALPADAPPETPEEKILHAIRKWDGGDGLGWPDLNSYTRDLDRASRRLAIKKLIDAGLIEKRGVRGRKNIVERFYLIDGEDA